MWQEEFKIAKSFNLDLIEFILDFNDVEENPLIKKGGIQEIKTVINDWWKWIYVPLNKYNV